MSSLLIIIGILVLVGYFASREAAGKTTVYASLMATEDAFRKWLRFRCEEALGQKLLPQKESESVQKFWGKHQEIIKLLQTATGENVQALAPVVAKMEDQLDYDLANEMGPNALKRWRKMSERQKKKLFKRFCKEHLGLDV
jgi:hypothetical protein